MNLKNFPIDKVYNSNISYSYLAYGEVYKDAVNSLSEQFDKDNVHHDYGILPLLFIFRHYIELKLTGLILYISGTLTLLAKRTLLAKPAKTALQLKSILHPKSNACT